MKNTLFVLTLVLALLLAACGPAAPATPLPEEGKALSVFGAYATAIEEPWDGVIHGALQEAQGSLKFRQWLHGWRPPSVGFPQQPANGLQPCLIRCEEAGLGRSASGHRMTKPTGEGCVRDDLA